MCTCMEHAAHKQANLSLPLRLNRLVSASSTALSPLPLHSHTSCSFISGSHVIDWLTDSSTQTKEATKEAGALPLRLLVSVITNLVKGYTPVS